MVHNIDTLGADLDPALLGLHIRLGGAMTIEVITRRIEDRGGGLARVDGRLRLLEGLALPREEDEFALSYYNSNTFWIDIDKLLAAFGLRACRPGRRREGGDRHPQPGGAHADLHHAQRRQEALGAGPGRRLPGGAVREAMGRHDRAAPSSTAASSPCPGCAGST